MKRSLVLAAFLLASTPLAAAAAPSPADEARAAMRRGNEALDRRDGAAALSEYERAKALVPEANAPYYFAATALELLGRWREAVENFEAYVAKDPTVSDAAEVKGRILRIRATQFPAHLDVRVTGSEEATVFVDGAARGRPGRLEVAPGPHIVEARAAGFESALERVSVDGDTEAAVSLALVPLPAPPPPPAAAPAQKRASPWATVGWVAAGAGAATIATALVLDVSVLRTTLDDYNEAASARNARLAGERLSEAETLRGVVLTSYVVGAVLVAGGLALGLFAPARSASQGSAALGAWTF